MELIQNDLFASKASLCHCVSVDLKMGAGIAVEFKKRFGRVKELEQQNPEIGKVLYLKDNGRFIFYLITKEKYYNKPSYESLNQCLINLYQLCKKFNLTHLAMPKIGCGLDKLEWEKVELLIRNIFVDIRVDIYYL